MCLNLLFYFNVCSVSELRELSEDEEKLLQILENMPEVQKLSADRESICQGNEQLASECMDFMKQ
jgi:hypothetical protein